MDTGENPEVPFPRDMIDLEVKLHYVAAVTLEAKLGRALSGI